MLLAPLLVLAITFEGVFALHTGVERIGRYLQVMFEEQDGASLHWETAAMRFGRLFSARGSDPLFAWLFVAATLINLGFFVFAVGRRPALALAVVALAHAALIVRIVLARRSAATQRARDLDRYRAIVREHEGQHGRPQEATGFEA
jgi:hypothetical protein